MRIVKSDREQRGPRDASIERHAIRSRQTPVSAMRALCLVPDGWDRLSVRQRFCSFAVEPGLLRGPCPPRLLLARLSGARPARPLDGLIGPQDGKASIALPQWRRRDFL